METGLCMMRLVIRSLTEVKGLGTEDNSGHEKPRKYRESSLNLELCITKTINDKLTDQASDEGS